MRDNTPNSSELFRLENELFEQSTTYSDIKFEDCRLTIKCTLAETITVEQAAEFEKEGWKYFHNDQINAAFDIFYSLLKRNDELPSVLDGIISCYEIWGDPASVLLNCQSLESSLKRHGRENELPDLYRRMELNYQLLSEKAAEYERAGNFKSAYYRFESMIEYGRTVDPKAYAGYLRNCIPGGKHEDAYKTIEKKTEYKSVILNDPLLTELYSNLVSCVENDAAS